MKYRTIDLCAGIGGIRRGFEMTGKYKNVLSAEIDELACQTYENIFHDDPRNDLTSPEFKEKVRQLKYDGLLAGFPCQAFSRVGLRLGFRDKTKGTIFFDIAEMIQQTQPKFVFLENVENLVRHEKGNTFRTIINILEKELDYKVIGTETSLLGDIEYNPGDFVRNSKDFGIPQNRPRVYIIAYNRKYFGKKLQLLSNSLPEFRPAGNIYPNLNSLLDTGDIPAKFFLSSGYLETLEKHKLRQKGKGYGFGMKIVNAPEIEYPIASTLLATGGSGRERNLVIDDKNGAKHANCMAHGKKTPINNKNIRTMTPTEWGKLQGFVNYAFINEDGTDGFAFPATVSDVQKYKQFGNSVTIPVIETMASYIFDCITVMVADFSPIEKRLFTMYGKNFLMCHKLYRMLGSSLREQTFLQLIDGFYAMGMDHPFAIQDLSRVTQTSYVRTIQILTQLVSIGFAEKINRGQYIFTSRFIEDVFEGRVKEP